MENNSYNQNQADNFNNSSFNNQNTAPLSLGQYLGMMLLMIIPLVNIILLLVWSFGDYNVNKKNYARASLIMLVIGVIITILFGAALTAVILQNANSLTL
ncbi:hypothetical protein M2651_13210 [Clostridium sp. SYSU_GA19001]|uniref:hypothetical protein n=1 Tax=Clostridium caldaquaticum TaxID=2940653 RepID=UPI002077992F|nr:hypothetical protein [Clostridium caldaquaticum]MCM8711958.1 hypothetical protein [Clostridium caldaquaticum]